MTGVGDQSLSRLTAMGFRARMLSRFSRVRLFVTPWTVARRAPLSGVGCHALLQGSFLSQGLNWHLHLWHCRRIHSTDLLFNPDFFQAVGLLPILQVTKLEIQGGKDDHISENQST